MNKNLLLTALLLAAMVVSCASSGGSSAATGEPKVELVLKAEDAELVTTGQLQIEDANKNLGWWGKTDDQAKWTLEVPEDGEYKVTYRYSLDPQFPGSTVKLTVGDASIEYVCKDTSAWSSYVKREAGKMNLKKGKQPVVIQATKIANRFVMNLTDIIFQKY